MTIYNNEDKYYYLQLHTETDWQIVSWTTLGNWKESLEQG